MLDLKRSAEQGFFPLIMGGPKVFLRSMEQRTRTVKLTLFIWPRQQSQLTKVLRFSTCLLYSLSSSTAPKAVSFFCLRTQSSVSPQFPSGCPALPLL